MSKCAADDLCLIPFDEGAKYAGESSTKKGKPYSFQPALVPNRYSESQFLNRRSERELGGYWYLFREQGLCISGNDGVLDCFGKCSDPAHVFSSLYAMHNCIAGIFSTFFTRDEVMYGTQYFPSLEIPIKTMNTSDAISIANNTFLPCLEKACDSLPGCLASYSLQGEVGDPDTEALENFKIHILTNVDSQICGQIPARCESDIGGIGVFLAYWIQSGLVLLAFLAFFFLRFVIPNLRYLRYLVQPFGPDWPMDYRKWSRKHLSRLMVALTDLSKTMSFFMAATSIAALITTVRGTSDPESLQKVYNNYVFIKISTISGFLPVSFTLFLLHLANLTSWYLIMLSSCSIILSIVTLGNLGTFKVTQSDFATLENLLSTGGPSECGGFRPHYWCLQVLGDQLSPGDSLTNIDGKIWGILGFNLFVICLIISSKAKLLQPKRLYSIPRLLSSPIRRTRVSDRISRAVAREKADLASIWNRHPDPPEWTLAAAQARTLVAEKDPATQAHPIFFLVFQPLVYLAIIIVYLFFFQDYIRSLLWLAENSVYNNEWGFGQIISISVWAPVIGEYIYLEMRGLKKGMRYKLLPPYRVTTNLSRSRLGSTDDGGNVEGRESDDKESDQMQESDTDSAGQGEVRRDGTLQSGDVGG